MSSRTAVAVLIAVAVGGCSIEDPQQGPIDDPVETSRQALTGCHTPFGGTARAIPGTIQAEDFDVRPPSCMAYNDTTAGNNGNSRTDVSVDLQAGLDQRAGHNVGLVAAGEWLKYTVNVTAAGQYTLELRVAATATGRHLDVSMDGTLLADNWADPQHRQLPDLPVHHRRRSPWRPALQVAAGAVQHRLAEPDLDQVHRPRPARPRATPPSAAAWARPAARSPRPTTAASAAPSTAAPAPPPAPARPATCAWRPAAACARCPSPARAALATAVSTALPGDCIVLANGNYTFPTLSKTGTADRAHHHQGRQPRPGGGQQRGDPLPQRRPRGGRGPGHHQQRPAPTAAPSSTPAATAC